MQNYNLDYLDRILDKNSTKIHEAVAFWSLFNTQIAKLVAPLIFVKQIRRNFDFCSFGILFSVFLVKCSEFLISCIPCKDVLFAE